MLADETAFVIGADTHRDRHALAVVRSPTGLPVAEWVIDADPRGYRAALGWAQHHATGPRVWALEGTGAYGAGLARFLQAHGERVVEIDRPARNDTAGHLKDDRLDAIRAAQTALGRAKPPIQPRAGAHREALRVLLLTRDGAVDAIRVARNQLKALIVTAPAPLREQLRSLSDTRLLERCARLRLDQRHAPDQRATRLALRACAQRVRSLAAEARTLEREILIHVRALAPQLLDEPGVGPISAAQILVAWSHPGRFPSDAHFAQLAGVAPIPASSGARPRWRLNRRGDRKLNRALHTIITSRRKHDPATIAYLQRRQADGKSSREATRCLKRYLARHLWRLLEHPPLPTTP